MTRQWNKPTKKQLYLLVALGLALVLSSGTFAYTYVTSIGTIGVTPPTADIATCNATASQPDWGTILIPSETTSTEILNPNAAGDETNIQSQLGAGAHWQLVDDWPAHDGDGTVVYTANNSWEEDLYNLPSHSATSGNVTYIKVYIVYRSTAVPSQTNAYVHIKTNGVEYNGNQETMTTSYATYSYQWNTNPQTSANWTWNEIDALQIGAGLREPSKNQYVRITQVYAEVNYTAVTYYATGMLTSTNLLSGETVESIDSFDYNASSIPSGTGLKVQFSQDGTNWYNSAGTSEGFTYTSTKIFNSKKILVTTSNIYENDGKPETSFISIDSKGKFVEQ